MSDEVTRQMREQREDTTGEAAWVKENVMLRDELARLRKDRDHWKTEAGSWHATVMNTAKELGETQRAKETAEKENKQLREKLAELNSEIEDLTRAFDEGNQQAEQALALREVLRKELEDAQNGCLKLGAEVIELREERDKWKVEAAKRFNQITGLNTKVNELKEEISHLRGLRRQNDAVIKELRMLVVAGLKG